MPVAVAVLFSPSTTSAGRFACVHTADLISACCSPCHQGHLPAVNKLLQQREECLVGVSWWGGGVRGGQGLCVGHGCHTGACQNTRSYSTLSQLRLCLAATETLQRSEPPVHTETSETPPV